MPTAPPPVTLTGTVAFSQIAQSFAQTATVNLAPGSSLTIPANETLTLAPGQALNVGGSLTNNGKIVNTSATTFVLEAGGSLLDPTGQGVLVNGSATQAGTMKLYGTVTQHTIQNINGTLEIGGAADSNINIKRLEVSGGTATLGSGATVDATSYTSVDEAVLVTNNGALLVNGATVKPPGQG